LISNFHENFFEGIESGDNAKMNGVEERQEVCGALNAVIKAN
jgi:hypothetical protein